MRAKSKRVVTIADILSPAVIAEAIGDFRDNEQADCRSLVLVYLNNAGVLGYSVAGFEDNFQAVGSLEAVKTMLLADNEED